MENLIRQILSEDSRIELGSLISQLEAELNPTVDLIVRECVDLLQRNAYSTPELAAKVHGMVGLRNILVHDSIAIDDAKLYGLLDHVDDMSAFALAISRHLQK